MRGRPWAAASSRRQAVAYARMAIRLMDADALAVSAIDARAVRRLIETMLGSDGERKHVFGGALARARNETDDRDSQRGHKPLERSCAKDCEAMGARRALPRIPNAHRICQQEPARKINSETNRSFPK
jgi:hypothetical protein